MALNAATYSLQEDHPSPPDTDDVLKIWEVKVVWKKQNKLGGGALPNMSDVDTDVDIVYFESPARPDTTFVRKKANPPVDGYRLDKIIYIKLK